MTVIFLSSLPRPCLLQLPPLLLCLSFSGRCFSKRWMSEGCGVRKGAFSNFCLSLCVMNSWGVGWYPVWPLSLTGLLPKEGGGWGSYPGGGDLTGPLSCLLLAPSARKWGRGGRGRGLGGKPLAFQWAANVVSCDFSSSIHGERHLGLRGGVKGL